MNICSKTTKSSLVGERALEIENTLVFSSLYKNALGSQLQWQLARRGWSNGIINPKTLYSYVLF